MLSELMLVISVALSPGSVLKNNLARVPLLGTWKIVGTVDDDGKFTAKEQPAYKIVISLTTICFKLGNSRVLEETYSPDVSGKTKVLHETVTYAPCFCGASPDRDDDYSFDGRKLIVGGAVLERLQP